MLLCRRVWKASCIVNETATEVMCYIQLPTLMKSLQHMQIHRPRM